MKPGCSELHREPGRRIDEEPVLLAEADHRVVAGGELADRVGRRFRPGEGRRGERPGAFKHQGTAERGLVVRERRPRPGDEGQRRRRRRGTHAAASRTFPGGGNAACRPGSPAKDCQFFHRAPRFLITITV